MRDEEIWLKKRGKREVPELVLRLFDFEGNRTDVCVVGFVTREVRRNEGVRLRNVEIGQDFLATRPLFEPLVGNELLSIANLIPLLFFIGLGFVTKGWIVRLCDV